MERTTLQTEPENGMQEEFLDAVSMNTPENLERGEIVEGIVVQIDDEYVWVDVNYKKEAPVPLSEFDIIPSENERVMVKILESTSGGELRVSKKQADAEKMLRSLKTALEDNASISGTVVKEAKGGLIVDFSGLEGYVPMSHMEIGAPGTFEEYRGQIFDFKVLKMEQRGKRFSLVVSRKELLEGERTVRAAEIFETVKVGDILEGVVKRITRFGVFVSLGGFDGLIQYSDLSWKRGVAAEDIVSPGDTVKVKVVSLRPEKQQIGLSLKDLSENPFAAFSTNHQAGDVIDGKVVKIEKFGAFVEVSPGVEGLLHISELSWTKRVNNPKEVLDEGSLIKVKILDIDTENSRISLGMKQMLSNPYDSIDVDFPLNSQHTGKISQVNDYGIFIELSSGIEGLVRKEDISWDPKEKNYKSQFKPGQMLEVQILRVDKKARKIGLGIKQMQDNPFEVFRFNNPTGTKTQGTIMRITDFGAFVQLAPEIEGLVHISRISEKRVEKVEDVLKVGETVNVKILDVDTATGKISLSIKDYDKDLQNEMITEINGEDKGTFRLGDMVNLKNLN